MRVLLLEIVAPFFVLYVFKHLELCLIIEIYLKITYRCACIWGGVFSFMKTYTHLFTYLSADKIKKFNTLFMKRKNCCLVFIV